MPMRSTVAGVIHSSDETAVMAVERRYDLIQLKDGDNCEAV